MSTASVTVDAPTQPQNRVYNRVFWLSYAANLTLVSANALTFRFAELVKYLGGTEKTAGAIVSAGVMGALAARFLLGQAIDHYGTRRLWTGNCLLFLGSCSLFLVCRDISWLIFAARVGFAVSVAGMFTCSIVHIQNQVPAERRTEVIGNLGSSGFLGMIVGTQIGDVIFGQIPDANMRFTVLFSGAVLLGAIYLLLVVILTRGDTHSRPHYTPPAHRLIFRYWPGNVALVAVIMGVSLTVTTVFLTRYATHLQLNYALGTFFAGYSIFAFGFRIATRHWSRTFGRHRMILCGLAGHAIAHAILPFVRTEWQFLIPAVAGGFGHALLFPAVVSKGAGQFPKRYRGSGTTLVLGFVDLGTALFAPLLGSIIDHFDHVGFSEMFFTSAGTAVAVAVIYALTTARKPDLDRRDDDDSVLQPPRKASVDSASNESSDEEEPSVAVPFPHVGRSA